MATTLLQIQERQFEQDKDPEKDLELSNLRARVSPQILRIMDRWFARGKRALAKATHGACDCCHIRLPIGVIANLRRGSVIQLCGGCGRYLYYVESNEPATPPAAPVPRKRRQSQA